jgi:hypothetical protein
MFSDVSDLLLNRTVLNIGSQRFKIFEIEFYVNDFDVHYDTFAQGQLVEKTKGKWLLRGEGAAYKLELTIGKALGLDTCGCVRICSILPFKSAVKPECGSEVQKAIIGPKNVVL